ncbi:MAG: tetratricopeptide repeat protein [Alphaproteobacteria bacterium]|nr:tetratricopeptide repeat protein [Alphaproteobacteria bacterium]
MMATNPIIKAPSLAMLAFGLLVAVPTVALAADSGDERKNCPRGQRWSDRDGRCVPARAEDLIDDELLQQGRRAAREGRYEQALALLHAVKRDDDAVKMTYLGYSYRKLGQVDRGIAYYHEALVLDPDNVATREYLGEGYFASGRVDLARAELQEIERRCGTGCEEYQELHAALAAVAPR